MKDGRSLPAVIAQVEEDRKTRKDYLAPTTKLTALASREGLRLTGFNGDDVGLTSYAHGQVATDLGIPKVYYDRMRTSAPDLLAENVNWWLRAEERVRLVRLLRGNVRGWLSDRYRALDNVDLLGAIVPTVRESGLLVRSAEVTETKLYLKLTHPGIQRSVHSKRGDIVEAGVVISNSEVGNGALAVNPMVLILACLNGATFSDQRFRKYHTGRRATAEAETYQILSTEAKQADDRAFWLQVRDVVRAAFDEARFDRLVARMDESAATPAAPVGTKIEAVVQDVTERFALPSSESEEILKHFIEGGDLSLWGLSNAVTARSQQVADYEVATAMERAGGQIIELPRAQWEVAA